MRTSGFLLVLLALASFGHADRARYGEAVRSPDQDIDEIKAYRDQLLNVQRARELARQEQLQKQYEDANINTGSMQGRLFSPTYYRKLGRFPKPQHKPMFDGEQPHAYKPYQKLDPNQEEPLREKESAPDTIQKQPEMSENEIKQTTLGKQSTRPAGGEKVINVEKVVESVHEEHGEEEKVPGDGELHPTPAYRQAQDLNKLNPLRNAANMADVYFLAVVAGCSVAGLVGLVVAGVCWYRLQKNVKAASEAEYPAYGITGPTKERVQSPGDRKLAQSAQMYHYQHQKQQMIALEKANSEMKHDGSDEDSEEENEEGDYTVYECPGLAPTGEMEVKNPLFSEDTPVTPTMPGNK